MKKRKHIWILIAIAVLILGAVVSYFLPKRFGRNVTPSQVDRISVFDGSTGTSFLITAPEDIEYIVTNIQSIPMKRAGFSTNRTGFTFKIRYLDHSGKEMIPAFLLNSDRTICKDPFSYVCGGGLCLDYIQECEERYRTNVTESIEMSTE